MAADQRLDPRHLSGTGATQGMVPEWTGTRAKWTFGPYFTQAIVKSGAASVATNIMPPGIHIPYACTIVSVKVKVGTAPTGSSLTVVIKDGGTTVATVTVSASATTGSATPSYAVAADTYLTVDITGVGSTVAGSDVSVSIKGV